MEYICIDKFDINWLITGLNQDTNTQSQAVADGCYINVQIWLSNCD